MVQEAHSLMQEQLDLEEEMARLGSIRFNENHARLAGQGRLGMTKAGMHMTAGGIDRVSEKLVEWLQDQWATAQRVGMKNKVFMLLASMEPSVASFIALRVVINSLTSLSTYQAVALGVGSAIEDEHRFRTLKKEAPGLFRWTTETIKNSNHAKYRRTVANFAAAKIDQDWEDWGKETQLRVGVVLVEMIRKACGIIDIATKPKRFVGYASKGDTTLYIMANAATMAWIKAYNLESHLLCPVLLPTVVPPKDWTSPHDGGYWSDAIKRRTLVKTYSKAYLKELELLNPKQVYDAVNMLQRTPWRVNAGVLEVLQKVWQGTEPVAGLPPMEDPPMPSKPIDIDTDEAARKDYRRQAAKVWDGIVQLRSRRMQCVQIVSIAERFKNHASIYFPHQLDFRGRVYPQPPGLQPQGSDVAKGLLMFAEGKCLNTPEAERWFKVHGANCYGVDKVSFEDRLKWVKDNHAQIMDAAAEPATNSFWMKADSPFMFLAWCLEYSKYIKNPFTFVSHLSISMDASCSGLQHFSAMLRDPVGASSTNLTPSESPRDIYGEVAKVAVEKLTAAVGDDSPLVKKAGGKKGVCPWTVGKVSQMWLAYGIDRKICKRPVMTMPYGSTLFSCKVFVIDAVEERELMGEPHPFGDFLITAAGYLAGVIWDSIGEVVVAARQAMDWLRESAKVAAKEGLPVTWTAPSGFPVMQAYKETNSKRVKLSLGEQIVRLSLAKDTLEIDKHRQASGISPNFVHSCDAAALVMAVTRAAERGLKYICCVHDSFGTHAADTEMFVRTIKDTFVELYEKNDVLAKFKADVEGLGVKLPDCPEKGSLDIRQVLQSSYCFA